MDHKPRSYQTGPGCSKLTTSLVNVSLKFQTLISEISKFTEKMHFKMFSYFFQQNSSVYLVIQS